MPEAAPAQPGIDTGRYWAILVSRWRAVVAGLLIGLFLAVAYLLLVPTSYIASTTLSVIPITSDPYAANRNINNLIDMGAETTAARSYKVAQMAAGATPSQWSASDLRAATTVSGGADGSTLTINVRGSSEQQARDGAGAMADAYIQVRSEQAKSGIEAVAKRDQERMQALRASLSNAIRRLAAARPGSAAAAEASADQQIINQQISALLAQTRTLEGVDTTGGVILNPATMTQIVTEPGRAATLATGLAGGLLIGIIAAFVTHSRRKVVHSRHDLRREFEIESLGKLNGDSQSVATVAQRLLSLVTRDEEDAVALVFDQGTSDDYRVLSERLATELRKAGTPTVVMEPRDLELVGVNELVLVAVGGNATVAERLQAMRLTGMTIFAVRTGHTRMRDLSTLVRDAREMRSHIAGAVLVSPSLDKAKTPKQATSDEGAAQPV